MAVIPSTDYWTALTAKDFAVFSNDKVQMLLTAEMDEKNAVKLLKHLTQTVTQGISDGFQYDANVLISVKYLLECIQTRSSNIDCSVLSCVYYVSKYFMKKGEFRMVLELKPFMKNLKTEKTEDVLKVYYSFFYELYSFLKKQNRSLSMCAKTVLKIRYDYLDVLSSCHIKYLDLLLYEANHFVHGEETRNHAQCLEYGIYFLKEAKSILKECTVVEKLEKICGSYIQFVTSLFNNILISKSDDLLADVLKEVEVFQTSNESYNKIIFFFVNSLKAVLDDILPVNLIQQQTSALQHLMQQESMSVLFMHVQRFASVFTSVQGYWLRTRNKPFSIEEFMAISELALLLSSYLKEYIQSKQPSIEPAVIASLSLRFVVNVISLGINIILDVKNIKDKEPCDDVYKVLKQLSAVQTYSYELLVVIRCIDDLIWKKLWKMLALKSVKLASVLEHRGYIKHASEFYEQFFCGFFAMESLLDIEEKVTPEDCLYNALKDYCQCLVHQSKYEEALICIGVSVLFAPNYSAGLQRCWVSTKQTSRLKENINLQDFLITNVFVQEKLEMIFPNAFAKIYNKQDGYTLFRLLYWELGSYALYRSEMHNTICNIGTQLIDLEVEPVFYVEGIALFLSNMWAKYDVSETQFSLAYEKAVKIAQLTLKKNSNSPKWYILTLLGTLHYYSFFAQVTTLRKKLQEDVADKKDTFCSKVNRSLMKGFIDPSEAEIKSNVITTYSDLNVEKEHQILTKLVQALDSWTNVCNCELGGARTHFQSQLDHLLINVKTVAQAFALYGYPEHSVRAWMTYYKLCKSLEDSAATLYGLSQLLKFASNADDFDLWKEANELEEQIHSYNLETKEKEMLFSFFLTKSRCCLLSNKYDIGWQYLHKVNENAIASFGAHLIFAEKCVLLSKYYTHHLDFSALPENFEASNAFVAMIKAMKILKTLYNIGKIDNLYDNCSLHLTMMEAAEWTANLCLGMKMYHDGYSHLKTYLTCAQILGLASRCSMLVSKLAQFDLLCHELENAEVKVYGLEAILCLKNMWLSSVDPIEAQPPAEEISDTDSDCLSLDSDIARMKLLDVPSAVPAYLRGSPELPKSPFKMPFIISHKENCPCLFCHSLLLQTSLVEVTLIKAQLYVLKGENDLALSYFKGGMNLCDKLKDMQEKILYNLSSTIFGKISNSFFSLFDPFLSVHSKLSLEFGEFLFLTRHFDLVQHMTAYSLETLLQSQECNLHIALDMIDKDQVLYTEMNKTPPVDQTSGDDKKEKETFENGNSDTLSPRILNTPRSYRGPFMNAPALNRNEDHLHLSKTFSPSVVLKLDAKLKSTETENLSKKPSNNGRKKISTCINFNDSSVNNSILEVMEKAKCLEEGSHYIRKSSSDEISQRKDQEIEILSNGIETLAICTSNVSTRKTRNAGRGSKTSNANLGEAKEANHFSQNIKSKRTQKQNQIEESDENNELSLLPNTNKKYSKTRAKSTSNVDDHGSSKMEVSLESHKSCQSVKNTTKMKEESTNEMSNSKTNTKIKPKIIIYTDSSDSEFLSPDIPIKLPQNTLKELNLPKDCVDTSVKNEKLFTPLQRKNKNKRSSEKDWKSDNRTKSIQKSSSRNNTKVTRNTRKVPVITLKSSESDNSPEDKCVKMHNNCIPADEAAHTSSPPPECVFEDLVSSARKPTLRKYERKTALPLESTGTKHTPASVKTVSNTSAKKGVTRKKRNPYVL